MSKNRSLPEPTMLNLGEGKQEPAYAMKDAVTYLGVTAAALQRILGRRPEIKRYQMIGRERYLLVRDLDELLRARPVE